MVKKSKSKLPNMEEYAEPKTRLKEKEETLHAIHQYMADAFVADHEQGAQAVTRTQADILYHRMVEAMNEGAVTLIPNGAIFYCNPRFGQMLEMAPEQLVGVHFRDLILPAEREAFARVLDEVGENGRRGEFCLQASTGKRVPVQLSLYQLPVNRAKGISILATDITERLVAEEKIRMLASALTKTEQVERHRISVILHDDLQQRLFAVKAQLGMLTDAQYEISPEMESTLDQVQHELSNAVTIIRTLSVNLSPVILHGEGLTDAIDWLAYQMKDEFGLRVGLSAQENFKFMEEHLRVQLFRAVRELLFNIVKHSGTLQATVTLAQVDDHIRITVSDVGNGFDAELVMNDPSALHGLSILRDRLSLVDGRIEVHSKLGEGTQVVIETPLEEAPV
jgi:PAS domain S-box-containing protein